MKIQLETIQPDTPGLIRLLHNPRLNDLFYWHFHPELELVFIENATATRHVGDHISTYTQSDLVLIGANLPHLNFDYGVTTDYKKEVLHLKPSFATEVIEAVPELHSVKTLLDKAAFGIAFTGDTKARVGKRMQQLYGMAPSALFIEVLYILQVLAASEEYILLHDKPFVNRYKKKEQERLRRIYAFIDEHYQRKIEIEELADLCNLGKEAFCRYFKKATGSTFVAFLNQYRISQAKRVLMMGKNVGEACYECGFDSLSYFNRTFKKVTMENPSAFRKKHVKL
jgi:AraC-like DNA-binding protein